MCVVVDTVVDTAKPSVGTHTVCVPVGNLRLVLVTRVAIFSNVLFETIVVGDDIPVARLGVRTG